MKPRRLRIRRKGYSASTDSATAEQKPSQETSLEDPRIPSLASMADTITERFRSSDFAARIGVDMSTASDMVVTHRPASAPGPEVAAHRVSFRYRFDLETLVDDPDRVVLGALIIRDGGRNEIRYNISVNMQIHPIETLNSESVISYLTTVLIMFVERALPVADYVTFMAELQRFLITTAENASQGLFRQGWFGAGTGSVMASLHNVREHFTPEGLRQGDL